MTPGPGSDARLREGFPRGRPDLYLRQASGENTIYDPASGRVMMLNETAWAIWEVCDGATSPDEIVDAICELSKMPKDVVLEDVARVLDEFDQAGFLTWGTVTDDVAKGP